MGCVAIGWPPRSSAYKMNRTPFDGAQRRGDEPALGEREGAAGHERRLGGAQQRPQGRHRARGSRHIRRGEREALERQGGEARTQRLDVGGGRERVGRFLRLERVVAASGSEQRGGDGDVPQEKAVTCWHAIPPSEGASLPGGRTRYRLQRTRDRRDGAVTGHTVPSRGLWRGERLEAARVRR